MIVSSNAFVFSTSLLVVVFMNGFLLCFFPEHYTLYVVNILPHPHHFIL
jgi:hypothetical protein